MTYVIAEPRIDVLDRACVQERPVDCIYERARALYIHPVECVDCGAFGRLGVDTELVAAHPPLST